MTTTAPTFNALSVVCPNDTCKAEIDQQCRSKSGKITKTPHRARVLAAGGTVPKLGRQKAPKRTRTRTTSRTPKTTVKKTIKHTTISAFVNDLEAFSGRWGIAGNLAAVDPESGATMTAEYDDGWLVRVAVN